MPHWIYYLLIVMQLVSLTLLGMGAWRCWKENQDLKAGRKHLLACLDKPDAEGSAKAIFECYANAYVIARSNTIVLGVVTFMWCLWVLLDIIQIITIKL